MRYRGNIQMLDEQMFYKGKHVSGYLLDLFDEELVPKLEYSEEMLFLLSLADGELVPYNNITNLPPLGLREFVTALGEMLKEGVYLSYMDKIFNGYPSDLILMYDRDILDVNRTNHINATLSGVEIDMITNLSGYSAVILDPNGDEFIFRT